MKINVLTVKQPWAHLIVHGYKTASGETLYKNVENRPRRTNHRGEIYIHAGKSFDESAIDYIGDFCPEAAEYVKKNIFRIEAEAGKVIGCVELTDCKPPHVIANENFWAEVCAWHWHLANPQPIVPFAARGQLGIWTMDAPVLIEREYFPEVTR